MQTVIDALDALALALAEHNHTWSNQERRLYERAIAAAKSTNRTDNSS